MHSRGAFPEVVCPVPGVERTEDFVVFFPVEVVLVGKIALRAEFGCFVDADKAGRILIGKRFDQGCVDEGEDGDAGGDAEGQHQNSDDGEAGVLVKLAEGETEVL